MARRYVRVLMRDGEWIVGPGGLAVGEALPDLPPPPPDPRQFDEIQALNGTLSPARLRPVAEFRPDGTSAATKTRKKYLDKGQCGLCGVNPLATKTLCAACAEKHARLTRATKARLAAHGLCVDCGKKNRRSGSRCDECYGAWAKKNRNDLEAAVPEPRALPHRGQFGRRRRY